MPISIDPNLVYLGLIAGLWVAVAAVYMPGTGIIEVAAFAICGIAIFCLVNMRLHLISDVHRLDYCDRHHRDRVLCLLSFCFGAGDVAPTFTPRLDRRSIDHWGIRYRPNHD